MNKCRKFANVWNYSFGVYKRDIQYMIQNKEL